MRTFISGTLLKTINDMSIDNLDAHLTTHKKGEYFIVINHDYTWTDKSKGYLILSQNTKTISPWCHTDLKKCFIVNK